jgi:hypothetical protein
MICNSDEQVLERDEYLTKFIMKWSLLAAAAVVVQWALLTLLP